MNDLRNANCGTRLKLERTKRSWTQEKLAEATGLSPRTIQRIERGTDPSLETLRLLANALEVEVEELSGASRRQHFRAPWSHALKISSLIFVVAFLSILAIVPWLAGLYDRPFGFLHVLVIFFPVIVIGLALAFSVTGYSVLGGKLLIHRLGWSSVFQLAELAELGVNTMAMVGSVKVLGNEGVFCYQGRFRNGLLGTYHAYVTDRNSCVVLRFGDRRIVVSPDDPSAFANTVEAALKELSLESQGFLKKEESTP